MPRCSRSWLARLLPAIALILSCCAASAAGAPRLALVVGNAAYPARPLATAANDAALVAQALAQAGFEVTAARDLDAARLRATLAAFIEAARAAGPEATLFVYLAGYGVQYTGGNFFVPVDARLVHDDDVPAETASLDELARTLAAVPAKARLIVADANRAQPFATADEMPLAPGLGPTVAPKDTIVAFAAAPDMVAPDDALPYGAYARALAETIAAPGVSAKVLFDQVRLRVGMLTNGEQVPWDDGVVGDDLVMTPAAAPAPAVPALPQPPGGGLSADTAYSVVIARDTLASYAEFLRIVADGPLAARIRVQQAVRREAAMWQAAAASDDPRAAWTYIRRYPRAPHRFDARRHLAALHATLEPPPRFDPFLFPALPPPPAAELPLVAAAGPALRGLPAIPVPPAALLPPADPAYYEELPMPAPAPAGLLPIAPPLPGAAGGEPGRVTQTRPGGEPVVSVTQLTPGSASVTLADTAGPILELVAADATGDARTLIETGPEPVAPDAAKTDPGNGTTGAAGAPKRKAGPPVLSRTIVLRTAEGVTISQVGADGGALLEITTRRDADGGSTTRVTNGGDELLAGWRRDLQGIVVARDVAPVAGGAAPAPASPPPRAAPAPAPRPAPAPQAPRTALPPAVPAAPSDASPSRAAVPAQPAPTPGPPPVSQPPPAPAPTRPSPAPSAPPAPILPKLAPPAPPTTQASPPAPPSTSPAQAEPNAATPSPPPSAAPLPPRRPASVVPKSPAVSRKPGRATAPKTARKAAPARKTPAPHRPAPRRGRR